MRVGNCGDEWCPLLRIDVRYWTAEKTQSRFGKRVEVEDAQREIRLLRACGGVCGCD
jgi:hypothetical protein